MMGDLLENFSGSLWPRTKHARKGCGNLWGQSAILKIVHGNCQSRRGRGVTNIAHEPTFKYI